MYSIWFDLTYPREGGRLWDFATMPNEIPNEISISPQPARVSRQPEHVYTFVSPHSVRECGRRRKLHPDEIAARVASGFRVRDARGAVAGLMDMSFCQRRDEPRGCSSTRPAPRCDRANACGTAWPRAAARTHLQERPPRTARCLWGPRGAPTRIKSDNRLEDAVDSAAQGYLTPATF